MAFRMNVNRQLRTDLTDARWGKCGKMNAVWLLNWTHISPRMLKPTVKTAPVEKTIKTAMGTIELATPRDRNGTFEPQLVKKHQSTLSDEIKLKIVRLFALGMIYQDISRFICLQRFHLQVESQDVV